MSPSSGRQRARALAPALTGVERGRSLRPSIGTVTDTTPRRALRGPKRDKRDALWSDENETALPEGRTSYRQAAKKETLHPTRAEQIPLQPLPNSIGAPPSTTPPTSPSARRKRKVASPTDSLAELEAEYVEAPADGPARNTDVWRRQKESTKTVLSQAKTPGRPTRAKTATHGRHVSLLDDEALGNDVRRRRSQRKEDFGLKSPQSARTHEKGNSEEQQRLADERELMREKMERTSTYVRTSSQTAVGESFDDVVSSSSLDLYSQADQGPAANHNSEDDDEFGFFAAAKRIRERKEQLEMSQRRADIGETSSGKSVPLENMKTEFSMPSALQRGIVSEEKASSEVSSALLAAPQQSAEEADVLREILGSSKSSSRGGGDACPNEVKSSSGLSTDDYLPGSKHRHHGPAKRRSTAASQAKKKSCSAKKTSESPEAIEEPANFVFTPTACRSQRLQRFAAEKSSTKSRVRRKKPRTINKDEEITSEQSQESRSQVRSRPKAHNKQRLVKKGRRAPAKKLSAAARKLRPIDTEESAVGDVHTESPKYDVHWLDKDIDSYTMAEELVI